MTPSRLRQQPQQGAQLDRSNRMVAGAQAVILGSLPHNLASGSTLATVGTGVAKLSTAGGIADSFRKNFYKATELLPAIGTQSFVEFWVGYPNASLFNAGGGDAGFLTGSSNNSTGIAGSIGTQRGVYPSGTAVTGTPTTYWGAIWSWGTVNSALEALTPGVLTCLVAVRRQDRMELWRNGVLVNSLTQVPTNYAASKFIVGGFVEDTGFWTSSSDMLMAGRVIGEPSAAEVRAFSDNPWSIFQPQPSKALRAAISNVSSAPPVTPPVVTPPAGDGGGAGPVREVRRFADMLDRAQKPTRSQKKARRMELVAEALELLPDFPEAEKLAPIAARIVYEQEARALAPLYANRPIQALQPVEVPFDAHAALREMIEKLLAEAIEQQKVAEDEENDIELLLFGT